MVLLEKKVLYCGSKCFDGSHKAQLKEDAPYVVRKKQLAASFLFAVIVS